MSHRIIVDECVDLDEAALKKLSKAFKHDRRFVTITPRRPRWYEWGLWPRWSRRVAKAHAKLGTWWRDFGAPTAPGGSS